MLTADRLRSVLAYDSNGAFTWKVKPSKPIPAGAIAGHVQKDTGYAVIRVDGQLHKAHRLAWLYVHGSWPLGVIDHINGEKSDNRIENLRDTTRAGNAQNQARPHRCNGVGVLGVEKYGNRFRARIRSGGRLVRLGVFETAEDAHSAYVAAKRELHATSVL